MAEEAGTLALTDGRAGAASAPGAGYAPPPLHQPPSAASTAGMVGSTAAGSGWASKSASKFSGPADVLTPTIRGPWAACPGGRSSAGPASAVALAGPADAPSRARSHWASRVSASLACVVSPSDGARAATPM